MELRKCLILLMLVLFVTTVVDAKKKKKKKRKREDLIANGGDVSPTVMALHRATARLIYQINRKCSATWISKDCVITTTNCASGLGPSDIQVSIWDVDKTTNDACEEIRDVEEIITETTNGGCQFVILKMTATAEGSCGNNHGVLACGNPWSSTAISTRTTGWGVTKDGVTLPDVLQFADTKSKLPPSGCLNQRPLTDVNCHVCTRRKGSGEYRGPCPGDGGGPLFLDNRTVAGMAEYVNGNCDLSQKWSSHLRSDEICGVIEQHCPGAVPGGATVAPTTVEPTTLELTTVEPTTVELTTVEPTTVEPTTVPPAVYDGNNNQNLDGGPPRFDDETFICGMGPCGANEMTSWQPVLMNDPVCVSPDGAWQDCDIPMLQSTGALICTSLGCVCTESLPFTVPLGCRCCDIGFEYTCGTNPC